MTELYDICGERAAVGLSPRDVRAPGFAKPSGYHPAGHLMPSQSTVVPGYGGIFKTCVRVHSLCLFRARVSNKEVA